MSNTLSDVLGLIDQSKWGRRYALVSLLALEDRPRPLTDHDLRTELGRVTKGEIRYDRKVLGWLLEEKVLSRLDSKGRHPALWWINPRVKDWEYRRGRSMKNPKGMNLGVPWKPSGRRVALSLVAQFHEPEGRSSEHFAGQEPGLSVQDLLGKALVGLLTRRDEVHANGEHVHTNGQSTPSEQPEHTFQVHTNGEPPEDPLLLSLERDSLSHSLGSGEREEDPSPEAYDRLRSAINRHGHRIIRDSKPGRRLRVLEMRYPERVDELEALAHTLAAKLQRFTAIIDELYAAVRRPAPQPASPRGGFRDIEPEQPRQPVREELIQEAREALGRPTPSVE